MAGRSLLMLLGSAAGAVLAIAGALILLLHAFTGSIIPLQTTGFDDRLQAGILGTSLLLVGSISIVAVYFGGESLRGADRTEVMVRPRRAWKIAVLLAIWLVSVWGSQAVMQLPAWKWSAAVLHTVAIAAPICALLGLAVGGLDRGSPPRTWGAFAGGMWLGTGVALIFEAILAVLGLLAAAAYFMLHPEHAALLQRVLRDLGGPSGMPEAFAALQPLLEQPSVLFLALIVFSVLAPIIEETAKSITTWLIVDRLRSSSAGFVTGALSGAGFALLEGLLASASPDLYWGTTLLVRAGSSMMHIAAAAVAGYGISRYHSSRRPAALAGGYLAAMGMHSLWNASIVVLAYGGLRLSAAGQAQSSLIGWLMIVAGASTLIALCLATPIVLLTLNRRLRQGSASQSLPPAAPLRTGEAGTQSLADVGK